jgi:hypothetical protein
MLGTATTTEAHHGYARFDRCRLFTVAGEIESLTWHNPHVEFTFKTRDGTTYTVVWLSVQQLKRNGVAPDSLKVGDHIEVTGAKRPEEDLREITLMTSIWRPGDGWRWSQPPQGC